MEYKQTYFTHFLTKEDKIDIIKLLKQEKAELMRSIYFVGLTQFVAIVASVLLIVKFALKS